MIKKIVLIMLIAALLLTGAIVYLNSVLLPTKVKAMLLKELQKRLNRDVTIEEIRYSLFKGIEIKKLTIFDKAQFDKKVFLSAENVSLKISMVPLVLKQQIILPTIAVDTLTLNIVREGKYIYNITDLLKLARKTTPEKQTKFNFLALNLTVRNSTVDFSDTTRTPPFISGFEDLNAKVNIALPARIRFDFDGALKNHLPGARIAAQGTLDTTKNTLDASMQLQEIDVLQLRPYYTLEAFTLNKGIIHNADFQCALDDNQLDIVIKKTDLDVDFKKNRFAFAGRIATQSTALVNLKNLSKSQFNGTVMLTDSKFSGMKFVNSLDSINGTLTVTPEIIASENLKARAFNAPLVASVSLKNYMQDPLLNAAITSDLDLSALHDLFPEKFKRETISLNGKSALTFNLESYLKQPGKYDFSGKIDIFDAKAKVHALRHEIQKIKGAVAFTKEEFRWNGLSGTYQETIYDCSGSLKNPKRPHVNLNLISNDLSLDSTFDVQGAHVDISQLGGKFFDTQFDIAGGLNLAKQIPTFNAKGNISLELADLQHIFPGSAEAIEKLSLKGTCAITTQLSGIAQKWKNGNIQLSAQADAITFKDLQLKNVMLDCQRNNALPIDVNLNATTYDGQLALLGKIIPRDDAISYSADLDVAKLDIAQLKEDTPLKNRSLSGLLSTQLSADGNFKNSDSLTGEGNITVIDGNLWQLDLLKGLGKALSITLFEEIIFTEGYADFTINNGKISTQNLKLESEELLMLAEGNVDFAGNLNFSVGTESKQSILKDTENIKDLITAIPTKASQFISVKIVGNIKSPKYIPVPSPTRVLKQFKDVLEGIVK
ncbi:DUF748 domain-containing protein [Candidatus Omnitrophota bacterium]